MSETVKECPFLGHSSFDIPYYISDSDFEVKMDKLASEVGILYTFMEQDKSFFCMMEKSKIIFIIEMLYHLTTALREDYTLTDEETEELIQIGHRFDKEIPHGFILPVSWNSVAAQAHVLRASCREMIVYLRKVDQFSDDAILDSTCSERPKVDKRLYDIFNSLTNYFFGLAVHCSDGRELVSFKSRTY